MSVMEMATEDRVVGSAAICRKYGVTYRQLDYWERSGLLVAENAENVQSGVRRVFSPEMAMRAGAVKTLLDSGMTLQAIRRAVEGDVTGASKRMKRMLAAFEWLTKERVNGAA